MDQAHGLTEAEALARRARGLANAQPPTTARTYRAILRENAFTFINFVVFGLAVALLALGQWSEALVSIGVVSINVIVGLAQEIRAKLVLDRIAILTRPRARVLRDGVERDAVPGDIVRGDVLVVGRGDQVIVDGTILAGNIDVDESLLSGESEPVARAAGDRVLSGSFCVRGEARYEATDVGESSYANRATRGARAPRRVLTPLQRQVEIVVRVLLFVAGSFAAILVASAAIEGQPAVEIVRRAVVVMGLVPNGLFVGIATAYALGAARMAGRGMLVQQTNAVESLSNVDVLCLDKTGTITTGRLRLELVRPLCGDEAAARRVLGDVAASATAAGRTLEAVARDCEGSRRPPRDEAPFASGARWSGIGFADGDGLFVIGAPEVIAAHLPPATRRLVDTEVASVVGAGLRVLVLARAASERFARADGHPVLPEHLEPLAVIGLRDELRPSVRETIAAFSGRGIAVKLVSGDHPETVRVLARASGIRASGPLVVGSDVASADDGALGALAQSRTLFARMGPEEKARLVGSLRAQGRYVAVIGDGVNDVPALKRADLAIALNEGAQAARGVADLILLDNSFEALPVAFREGQRVLAGMQDLLRLFLVRIASVALLVAATALVGIGFPYTPKQSGLLSFFAVGAPALVLVVTARPAAHVRERLVASLARFVVPAAWSLALVGLLLYVSYASATTVERAQSVLTLTTTLCGVAIALFAAPPSRFWTAAGAPLAGRAAGVLGAALVAALAWILVEPSWRSFFDLDALVPSDVPVAALVAAVWAFALRWSWTHDLFERALGLPRQTVSASVAPRPAR